VIAVALIVVAAFLSVGGVMIATGDQPAPTGEVLAARQAGPAGSVPPPSASATGEDTPAAGAPATPTTTPVPPTPVPATPVPSTPTSPPSATPATTPPAVSSAQDAIEVGRAELRAWHGSLGELRLQVIVAVRNTGSSWARLTRSASSYEVYDSSHRQVAGGVFTAALPEVIGPGETAYLVDTLSLAFGKPTDFVSSSTRVETATATQLNERLTVTSISLSTGADQSLRARGEVRNDGDAPARSIVAGVVVLDQSGRPLAAVYDLTDTGELAPGATVGFDTEYPGAPPVPDGAAGQVMGYGFTTGE
jgi:hypothetical protein